MNSTPLSTILARMDRWQAVYTTEEQYKVKDIDAAIRRLRRKFNPPWALKKTTLRVFPDVLLYPVESDHAALAHLENPTAKSYGDTFRGVYTSLKQFLEDPDDRNDIAEVWDNGERFLGIRAGALKGGSTLINNASDVDDFSVSSGFDSVGESAVIYKEEHAVMIYCDSGSQGRITCNFTEMTDNDFGSKYFFVWLFLPSAPTSIQLYFGSNDITNSVQKTVTAQFNGQSFKANDWNLLGFNLGEASISANFDSVFDFYTLIIDGIVGDSYHYLDASYLREWTLLDNYYYSRNNVLNGSTYQEGFMDGNGAYELTAGLIGDDEWSDVITYEALVSAINEKENPRIFNQIEGLRKDAWSDLFERYPQLAQLITINNYRFDDLDD